MLREQISAPLHDYLVVGRASLVEKLGELRFRHQLDRVDPEQGGLAPDGATVIAIITIAAYKLVRSTNRRDPLLWGIFAAVAIVTAWAEAELAEFFILAGLLTLLVRAWSGWRRALLVSAGAGAVGLLIWASERWLVTVGHGNLGGLGQILVFFTKAGAFVFGSGLAIVPFLHQGVVQQFGWLSEQQFLDAVAVAMITPGPVVITVAFIGYLVASFWGALLAAVAIFLPVYVFTVLPAPWFQRNRDNVELKAFVQGATAAATGAITGAVIVLAQRAVYDVPTAAIALVSLGVLWRFKVPEPVVVIVAGALGIVRWSLLRGSVP